MEFLNLTNSFGELTADDQINAKINASQEAQGNNNLTLFYRLGFPIVGDDEQGMNVTNTAKIILNSSLTTVFLPVVYVIVFIVGLPPNAMAVWVFLFRTKKKHPGSILLANLALADLLFIIWLPLKIAYHFKGNHWIFGNLLCKVLVGFFYGNMYCSTIFIACISVQRYWAVAHPLSHRLDNQVAVCVSLCVWLVVCLLTIPLYLYDQTIRITNLNITTCHDVTRLNQSHIPVRYFLTMGVVGYVVPCVVCVVAYLLMLRSLRKSRIDASINKKRKKAVVLMVIVLVIFLVCFTPSNVMLMVHYSLVGAEIQNEAYRLYIVAVCLGSLNSCLDPFVYYFSSKEFREHVRNVLKCRSERSAKQLMVSFTPVKSSTENQTSSTHTSTADHQVQGPLNTDLTT
ncbi:proteinase-activated receptor 2-like [Salminus brasiliensis]|uniref:proteinase-activated receptor 2-like n=1 Tax=Salminus brasiliensis TaxID=930266 RepID=UPI003B830DFC